MTLVPQINHVALRAFRDRSGLTVTQLAELVTAQGVELSRSHLSNIEAGRRPATPAIRNALAAALKVSVVALLTLAEVPDDPAA
jgi:transcriptional regulator with XRE-family HTH domain